MKKNLLFLALAVLVTSNLFMPRKPANTSKKTRAQLLNEGTKSVHAGVKNYYKFRQAKSAHAPSKLNRLQKVAMAEDKPLYSPLSTASSTSAASSPSPKTKKRPSKRAIDRITPQLPPAKNYSHVNFSGNKKTPLPPTPSETE